MEESNQENADPLSKSENALSLRFLYKFQATFHYDFYSIFI